MLFFERLLARFKTHVSESSFVFNRHHLFEYYGLQAAADVEAALHTLRKVEKESDPSSYLTDPSVQSAMQQIRENLRETPPKPDVSIIIPIHNHILDTIFCLLFVSKQQTKYSFEVIVGDDASTDDTASVLRGFKPGIVHERNTKNVGFLNNCNRCAQTAKGRYLVFLNNDTLVLPGWLEEIVKPLEDNPKIGLVGSKLLFEDIRLQEAGGIVWNDASAWNYGRDSDATLPMYNYVKDVDYCSGASLAIPSALWRKLKGFDELYSPAYYEDTDLAFRVREAGYRTIYQPKSALIHREGISHGRALSSGIKQYLDINKIKFLRRWQQTLEKEHFPNGQSVSRARDRSQKRPHILVVDHYIPTPGRDAGSRAIQDLLRVLSASNAQVTFWPDNLNRDAKYIGQLQDWGIEVIYGNKFANFKKWIEERPDIDYAILSRPHISPSYLRHIRSHTEAKILYYGHDIHHLRLEQQLKVADGADIRKEWKKYKKLEHRLWNDVDVIYYPSEIETCHVNRVLRKTTARTFPLFALPDSALAESKKAISPEDFSNRAGIMFVGGFGHPPNSDGIKWFVNEIWPFVAGTAAVTVLSIVGFDPPADVLSLASNTIRVLGHVDSAELKRLYRASRLAIAPLRFGGGMKGKVLEAFAMGTPIVTTSVGMQGLQAAQSFAAVSDKPRGFAKHITHIYGDPAKLHKMAAAGIAFMQQEFSNEMMLLRLRRDIPDL